MQMIEALVVLEPSTRDVAVQRLRARFDVAAALPPRLFVVRLAAGDLPALRAVDGVASVAAAADALAAVPSPSEAERLFVAGWGARGAKSGPRPRDGLDWDAPGAEPPDAPRR